MIPCVCGHASIDHAYPVRVASSAPCQWCACAGFRDRAAKPEEAAPRDVAPSPVAEHAPGGAASSELEKIRQWVNDPNVCHSRGDLKRYRTLLAMVDMLIFARDKVAGECAWNLCPLKEKTS